MRIVFFDLSGLAYTPETPYRQPLGGSQSAICYLAEELARCGHHTTLVNAIAVSHVVRGVDVKTLDEGGQPAFLRGADAIVVLNAARGGIFRRQVGFRGTLVQWLTHAPDQPDVGGFGQPEERAAWSAFAFVSRWQHDAYLHHFQCGFPAARVMRNAMAPPFSVVAEEAPWFQSGAAPTLVYTSMPFRGLDVLLDAFPSIRSAVPATVLRIFSGMATYQVSPEKDGFGALYAKAAAMAGVEYIGPVGQRRLAEELASAAALAYPSTFAETSCIAVIEAMAAGAEVIATDYGALGETTDGFGRLVPLGADRDDLVAAFAREVVAVLSSTRQDPEAAFRRRHARIAFAREHFSWATRAREWADWLTGLARSPAA